MGVISISVNNQTNKELERIIREGGFKGRSDAFRAAIHLLSREQNQQKSLVGKVSGVLIVIHDEKHEADFSHARHEFEKVIKTSIHNQLGQGKCLELFILEGQATEVKTLLKECRKSGRAEYLKLITT